jgi:hypothetical protein
MTNACTSKRGRGRETTDAGLPKFGTPRRPSARKKLHAGRSKGRGTKRTDAACRFWGFRVCVQSLGLEQGTAR